MALLGEDTRGGWWRRLYAPSNPAGLGLALLFALLLVVLNQLLQGAFASLALATLFAGGEGGMREIIKASLVGLFPAALLTAVAAVLFARVRGGSARSVLALGWPQLGRGWLLLVPGFLVTMYAVAIVIVVVLGIDLAQYTPGPDGQSPESGSAGLVKEAMFDIANEPWLFALVLPSVALGAPIAEELTFRGQLFSALSLSRLGVGGATVVTAALWSLLHFSEPWLSIGLIFVMGLMFGWMMYRFGSLWVTMICHGVWNLTYSLSIFLSVGS